MNLCITELALCSQKLRAAVKMSSATCYWRAQQNPSPKNYEINDDLITPQAALTKSQQKATTKPTLVLKLASRPWEPAGESASEPERSVSEQPGRLSDSAVQALQIRATD